jgi:ribosome-binding factor A
MKAFSRAERVAGQVQKLLSEILQRRTKDPRLKAVVISGVKMSRDLRMARIYFAASGDEKNRAEVLEGFESARGHLKRVLAAELGLRYMPDMSFHYDDSFDYGENIERLLKSIQTENGSDR